MVRNSSWNATRRFSSLDKLVKDFSVEVVVVRLCGWSRPEFDMMSPCLGEIWIDLDADEVLSLTIFEGDERRSFVQIRPDDEVVVAAAAAIDGKVWLLLNGPASFVNRPPIKPHKSFSKSCSKAFFIAPRNSLRW